MIHGVDVTPEHLNIVSNIFRRYLPDNTTIWVFGSRAMKQAKPFSDLDIALCQNDNAPIEQHIFLDLEEAFDESPLPWKVDIVDMNNITDNFRAIINHHKVLLDI